MIMFHGTTHQFDSFDLNRISDVNHVGKGIYLTNSMFDVKSHYACVGPDLKQRIRDLATEINDGYRSYRDYDAAYELAVEALVGNKPQVLVCKVKTDNLFLLSTNKVINYDAKVIDFVMDYYGVTCSGYRITDMYGPTLSTYELHRLCMRIELINKNGKYEWGHGCQIFADIVNMLGYDGVEYEDAYNFFPGMVEPKTKHVVLYKPNMVEIVERKLVA